MYFWFSLWHPNTNTLPLFFCVNASHAISMWLSNAGAEFVHFHELTQMTLFQKLSFYL